MHVLIPYEKDDTLYLVGFYTPQGFFIPESPAMSYNDAIDLVHYLNGGDRNKYYTD